MKSFLTVLLVALTVLVACDKDKFQTKPTISIKSVNTEVVPLNGDFIINLECTDKEGDVQDSVIVIKRRLNKRTRPTVRDTLRFPIPIFPSHSTTEFQITLINQNIVSAISPLIIPGSNPPKREPDTLILRL